MRGQSRSRLPEQLAEELSSSRGERMEIPAPDAASGTTHAYVHTDEASGRAAASIGARAFTSGNNIYVGGGQLDQGGGSASELLRHEVAHVVANGRSTARSSSLTEAAVAHPSSGEELAAEAASRRTGVEHLQDSGASGDPPSGSYTTAVLHRSPLPIDSTVKIRHNVLIGESDLTLGAGEGVVVELTPDWFMDGDPDLEGGQPSAVDRSGVDRPPGLTDEVRVTLRRDGVVWNSDKGGCSARIGSWNRLVLKTDEEGTHRLVLDVDDHNHNFFVAGPLHVRKAAADELTEACRLPDDAMSGSEILHYLLDVAGLFPVLGVFPDAANAGFYAIEGDWAQAGISAAAMIPIFGEGATLVKLGEKAVVRISKTAAKKIERRAAATALRETKVALKTLRTPPAFPHLLNKLGAAADPQLALLAREARITQAGLSREAFEQFNVATARVRVGDKISYLSAGNSPGKMMHSEDWILSQVQELRKTHGTDKVVIEQLYSERIPCKECLAKLTQSTNAELFYSVREFGKRASDLMKAYGL